MGFIILLEFVPVGCYYAVPGEIVSVTNLCEAGVWLNDAFLSAYGDVYTELGKVVQDFYSLLFVCALPMSDNIWGF